MKAGNANASWRAGVGAKQVGLGEANDSGVFDWQQGLEAGLIAKVYFHRWSHPWDPLPAAMQRELASAWLSATARQRC